MQRTDPQDDDGSGCGRAGGRRRGRCRPPPHRARTSTRRRWRPTGPRHAATPPCPATSSSTRTGAGTCGAPTASLVATGAATGRARCRRASPPASPGVAAAAAGPATRQFPAISPADGATIAPQTTFSAQVTDPDRVRSVQFDVAYGGTSHELRRHQHGWHHLVGEPVLLRLGCGVVDDRRQGRQQARRRDHRERVPRLHGRVVRFRRRRRVRRRRWVRRPGRGGQRPLDRTAGPCRRRRGASTSRCRPTGAAPSGAGTCARGPSSTTAPRGGR